MASMIERTPYRANRQVGNSMTTPKDRHNHWTFSESAAPRLDVPVFAPPARILSSRFRVSWRMEGTSFSA